VPTKDYRLPTEWVSPGATVFNVSHFKNMDEEALLKAAPAPPRPAIFVRDPVAAVNGTSSYPPRRQDGRAPASRLRCTPLAGRAC